jgi:hypothetical protein
MLIELKAGGDWRADISQACAQLYTYSRDFPEGIVQLAAFGARLQHQHLEGMLAKLDIRVIQRSGA